MDIPKQIDKRAFNTLTKKNKRWLLEAIQGAKYDMLLEGNWLVDDWDPENKYMDKLALDFNATAAFWLKEMKAAIREFKSNKIKLLKAHNKYLEEKKKK